MLPSSFMQTGRFWCNVATYVINLCVDCVLLNQVRTAHRPARTWFIKIDPVRIVGMRVRVHVCVCVCVSAPEAIYN